MSALDLAGLRETRAVNPAAIAEALASRARRPLLQGDNRLLLIAADHPGRGALAVGADPRAMADRTELLARLVVALARPGVDGMLATPDIIDDLALLGALDGKVVVGSMNRGGLRGAAFEMDDRFTGYDVAGAVASGLDAAKLLLRVNSPTRQPRRPSSQPPAPSAKPRPPGCRSCSSRSSASGATARS